MKYLKTINVLKTEEGSDWYGETGTFKPALPAVAACKVNERPKFKNNKELTAFIRARLAKQNAKY